MKPFLLYFCTVFMGLQWIAVILKYKGKGAREATYWVVAGLDACFCTASAWMGLRIYRAFRKFRAYRATGAIRAEAYYMLACDVGSFLLSCTVLIATLLHRDEVVSVLQDLFSCWNTVVLLSNRINDIDRDDDDEEVQPAPAGVARPPIEADVDVELGIRPAAPPIEADVDVELGVRPTAPGHYVVLGSYPCQADREIHSSGLCPCRFGLNLVPIPIPAPEVDPPYPVYRID